VPSSPFILRAGVVSAYTKAKVAGGVAGVVACSLRRKPVTLSDGEMSTIGCN